MNPACPFVSCGEHAACGPRRRRPFTLMSMRACGRRRSRSAPKSPIFPRRKEPKPIRSISSCSTASGTCGSSGCSRHCRSSCSPDAATSSGLRRYRRIIRVGPDNAWPVGRATVSLPDPSRENEQSRPDGQAGPKVRPNTISAVRVRAGLRPRQDTTRSSAASQVSSVPSEQRPR